MLSVTLKVTEHAQVHVAPDGVLDSPVLFTSDYPNVAVVTGPDPGNGMYWIEPAIPGVATISASATSYGQPLIETIVVTVQAQPATTLGITVDAPIHK